MNRTSSGIIIHYTYYFNDLLIFDVGKQGIFLRFINSTTTNSAWNKIYVLSIDGNASVKWIHCPFLRDSGILIIVLSSNSFLSFPESITVNYKYILVGTQLETLTIWKNLNLQMKTSDYTYICVIMLYMYTYKYEKGQLCVLINLMWIISNHSVLDVIR